MSTMPSTLQLPETWDDFRAVTGSPNVKLLTHLDRLRHPILVAGCQRSGTTILTQVLIESAGMVDYRFGADSELDGALILSGWVEDQDGSTGRYCFQTTYLNEKYHEYFELKRPFKLIWVLRNPASVVQSMLYNWGSHGPDRLFNACGIQMMSGLDKLRFKTLGPRGVSSLRRACYGYNGKTLQLFELYGRLDSSTIAIVDYDDLVVNKDRVLPALYDFLDLAYRPAYAAKIGAGSLNKKLKLRERQRQIIDCLSAPMYERARTLLTLT